MLDFVFTEWFHAVSDFKHSPKKQVIRSICITKIDKNINKQIVYRL